MDDVKLIGGGVILSAIFILIYLRGRKDLPKKPNKKTANTLEHMSSRFLYVIGIAFVAIVAAAIAIPNFNEKNAKNKVESQVREMLKDPESAQFRNLHKNLIGDWCGEVNAKNSMGGYTGFKTFRITKAGGVEMEYGEITLGNADLVKLNDDLLKITCKYEGK